MTSATSTERSAVTERLAKQTAYLVAIDGLLRTLPIPSEHAFDGARRYSEVLTQIKLGIAEDVATSRDLLRKLGEEK